MKRKLFLIGVAVLLLAGLLVPGISFASTSTSSSTVTEVEAEKVALDLIERIYTEIPEWNSAQVSKPITYYSPDDNKSAYEFTVLKDHRKIGFIFVSARKDWMPVLEFGAGKAPSNYLIQASEVALKKGYTIKEQNLRLLYWAGLTYSVQYGQEMKADGVAVHLPTSRIVKLPEGTVELQMDKEQARLAWDRLPDRGGGTRGSEYISGVPAYYQASNDAGYGDNGDDGGASWPTCSGAANDPWDAWDGCSPIAGAMIHGYWDSHGYSDLPDGEDTLIDDNHHYMDTSDEGSTYTSDRDDGIRDIFDEAGYSDDFDVHNDYIVSWNDIKAQVGWDFPSVLGIHGGSSPYSGGHSVTVVGYVEASENLVYLYNTWDALGHYITFGNWDSANMTKAEIE